MPADVCAKVSGATCYENFHLIFDFRFSICDLVSRKAAGISLLLRMFAGDNWPAFRLSACREVAKSPGDRKSQFENRKFELEYLIDITHGNSLEFYKATA